MFYVSIIFQKNLQDYPYSSILINMLSLGRGPEKNLDILGRVRKKNVNFQIFTHLPPSHK